MKESDPFYRTKRWKHLRESILRRDGYTCQESKRFGRMIQADTVHHIWPREDFPEIQWEPWNLVAVSAAVHDTLHDRQTGALTEKGMNLLERTEKKEEARGNEWLRRRRSDG